MQKNTWSPFSKVWDSLDDAQQSRGFRDFYSLTKLYGINMLIKLYENDCNFDIKKNLFQKPMTFLKLSKISILSQAFFAIQSIETNYKISFHYNGKDCKIRQN